MDRRPSCALLLVWVLVFNIILFASGGFSEEASRGDPQPCNVEEFPSLLARRIAYPEPHFVLFTADIDAESGQPWCPDCARMLESTRSRVKEIGGTLLEVQARI